MFFPEGQIRIHLYGQPCDMRRSFDGLQALVMQGLGADPTDGALYTFITSRGTQMRVCISTAQDFAFGRSVWRRHVLLPIGARFPRAKWTGRD